jgi:hypothetical protein
VRFLIRLIIFFIIPVLMAGIILSWIQNPIGCLTTSISGANEVVQSKFLIQLWQTLVGSSEMASHWLIMLLILLAMACVYRFARAFVSPSQAAFTILVSCLLYRVLLLLGLSILIASITSFFLVLMFLVMIWFKTILYPHPRVIVVSIIPTTILVLIAIAIDTRGFEFPVVQLLDNPWLVILWGTSALGYWGASRSVFIQWMLGAVFIVSSLVLLLFPSNTLLLTSIPFLSTGIIGFLSHTSLRTRVVFGAIVGISLLPVNLAADGLASKQVGDYLTPESRVILNLKSVTDLSAAYRFLNQVCQSLAPEVYYINDSSQIIKLAPTVTDHVDRIPSGESFIILGDSQIIEDTLNLVSFSTLDWENLPISLYRRPLLSQPVYQTKQVSLEEFQVRKDTSRTLETTFSSGETLMLFTWWKTLDTQDDNLIIKVELVDAQGQPLSQVEQLLASSFSGSWPSNSIHLDVVRVRLPVNIAAGDYSLIFSLHGSIKGTKNSEVLTPNGEFIGDYGYLTTIHVH